VLRDSDEIEPAFATAALSEPTSASLAFAELLSLLANHPSNHDEDEDDIGARLKP